jgi:hypothetical protein
MSTTLKTLIGKAKTYYAAMEVRKLTLPFTTPTSKLLIFDQLVEQYNTLTSESRNFYKARKENQTPDQVVAEMIYLALTDGISIQNDTNKPLKISFNDPGVLHASETMLKILDNCAQAELGELSIARARQNIARLEKAYKLKMEHVDAEADFLKEATLLLNTIEQKRIAAKEQQLKEEQAEKLAHQEELIRLNLKHDLEMADAQETIMLLKSELEDSDSHVNELHVRGSDLEAVADREIAHYEKALEVSNATIAELKLHIRELTARSDAILFLHKETSAREQQQIDSYNQMLSRYDSLVISSRDTAAARDDLIQHNINLKDDLAEARDMLDAMSAEKVRLAEETNGLNQDISDLNGEIATLKVTLQAQEKVLQEITTSLASKDTELAERDKIILELTAASNTKLKEQVAELAKLRAAKKEAQDNHEKSVKLSLRSQEQVQISLETITIQTDTIQKLREQIALLEAQVFELEQHEAPKAKDGAADKKAKSPAVVQEGAETGYLNTGDPAYSKNPQLMFNKTNKRRLLANKTAQVAPVVTTPTASRSGRRQ